jgi:hypothetical protein
VVSALEKEMQLSNCPSHQSSKPMLFNRRKPKFEMLPEPERGVVDEAIGPNLAGRVKAFSSIWPAEIYQPDSQKVHLHPGQSVFVVAIDNITLLVVPM